MTDSANPSDNDRQARIRERAHAIWHESGQPDGRHDEHWLQAESEIGNEDPGETRSSPTPGERPSGAPGGLSSSLQSGGTIPGGGPGSAAGNVETGGFKTAGAPTGTAKKPG